MSESSGPEPLDVTVVVDAERRVVESSADRFPVGAVISRGSWLEDAVLDAVAAALTAGRPQERVARDYARAGHWVVRAGVVSDAPWRARIVAVDATLAVAADRHAVLASVVHSVRNTGFALTSVLDALVLERAADATLGEYVSHLREPADRLSAIMAGVAAFLVPRAPTLASLSVDRLVEHALGRVAVPARIKSVQLSERAMRVWGDMDLLGEAIDAMLESAVDAETVLEVDRVEEEGRGHARVRVGRRPSPAEEHEPLALWDLGDGHRLDSRVRLSAARGIVAAHGGRVTAAIGARGLLWMGAHLPLVIGD